MTIFWVCFNWLVISCHRVNGIRLRPSSQNCSKIKKPKIYSDVARLWRSKWFYYLSLRSFSDTLSNYHLFKTKMFFEQTSFSRKMWLKFSLWEEWDLMLLKIFQNLILRLKLISPNHQILNNFFFYKSYPFIENRLRAEIVF